MKTDLTQDDASLNKMLMDDDELIAVLVQVFNEDDVFNMRAILVDRFGPNLRNDITHGRAGVGSFFSGSSIYLFWLVTRFLVIPHIKHWNALFGGDDTIV